MAKKAILWTFYLLFVGGLLWAAIHRSSATLAESSQNHGTNAGSDTIEISLTPPEENQPNEQKSEQNFIILNGKLTAIGKRDASITLEDGTLLTLNPRSWRFATEQGFQGQIGDALLVTVLYESEKIEVVHLRNLGNGSIAQLRDADGHPLWNSGGGNGN